MDNQTHEPFEVGDRVVSPELGVGTVVRFDPHDENPYCVVVDFDEHGTEYYTRDGKYLTCNQRSELNIYHCKST